MFYNIIIWLNNLISLFNIFNFRLVLNFDRGTSMVNFCESDIITNYFAETFNTWSSLAISILGIFGIYKILYSDEMIDILKKHQDINIENRYIEESKSNRYMLNFVLILIGLGSYYFHAELSEFAHWTDIICISWILILSDKYLDNILNYGKKIKYSYLFITFIHILSSLYIPSIHIFFQYATGYYLVTKINKLVKLLEIKGEKNYDINQIVISVKKKYLKIKIIFFLSVVIWIIDYFMCKYIHPYHIHWIFHIGIGFVGYSTIDLSKYLWLIKLTEQGEDSV